MLTGETGAGKSILLDAFALALGARGDASLVRHGIGARPSHRGIRAAAPHHPARDLLTANGIAAEDELILRRIQFADGRTRAFVNDQPVSAQVLRALGAALVEIHGQHDERALVEVATHRRLLDAFGGLDDDSGGSRSGFGTNAAPASRSSPATETKSSEHNARPIGCAMRSRSSRDWILSRGKKLHWRKGAPS